MTSGGSGYRAEGRVTRARAWGNVPRGRLLRAALGFLALEPRAPELQLLHRWADCWRGVGDVVVGMERQGYRLHLTNIEAGAWRATFSRDAMSAAEGFAAAPTPWTAVQRAAAVALKRG